MAPLSKEVSGVILPVDYFGTHLNAQGETIDIDLEKKNFSHAGKVLEEIWSNVIIDNFPVVAEYIEPGEITINLYDYTQQWFSTHVRTSQYFLQIVKCRNRKCCKEHRSSFTPSHEQRFLRTENANFVIYILHRFKCSKIILCSTVTMKCSRRK